MNTGCLPPTRGSILGGRRKGDYFNELFTDSAQRYLSEPDLSVPNSGFDDPLSLPVTRNVVVMITVAFEGNTRVGN